MLPVSGNASRCGIVSPPGTRVRHRSHAATTHSTRAAVIVADLTMRVWCGGAYLMPVLILIVSVLPPFEIFGRPVARSGVGCLAGAGQP